MPSPYKAKKLAKPAEPQKAPAEPPLAPAACPSLKAARESKSEAERAAAEKMADGSPPLWSYECAQCGAWHLTSKAPRARPGRAMR